MGPSKMVQRKTIFTTRELKVLVGSVAKRWQTIMHGQAGGQEKWAEAWRHIAREVSTIEGIRRSDADVRKKWTYLKWEAKNTQKPLWDPTSKSVLKILSNGKFSHVDNCSTTPKRADIKSDAVEQQPGPASKGPLSQPVLSDVKSISRTAPSATPPVTSTPPQPATQDEDICVSVKWNKYANNMSTVMPNLLKDEKFVDVTLACDGKYLKCHKVILGACSDYFGELLSTNPCQHPIILLKDFRFWEIHAIIDFIYRGVVNIPHHKLPKLLEVANILQIKGLTGYKGDDESEAGESIDSEKHTSAASSNAGGRKTTIRNKSSTPSPVESLGPLNDGPPSNLDKTDFSSVSSPSSPVDPLGPLNYGPPSKLAKTEYSPVVKEEALDYNDIEATTLDSNIGQQAHESHQDHSFSPQYLTLPGSTSSPDKPPRPVFIKEEVLDFNDIADTTLDSNISQEGTYGKVQDDSSTPQHYACLPAPTEFQQAAVNHSLTNASLRDASALHPAYYSSSQRSSFDL